LAEREIKNAEAGDMADYFIYVVISLGGEHGGFGISEQSGQYYLFVLHRGGLNANLQMAGADFGYSGN